MSAAKGKILVIRGGAIGDFILTLPVLAALRAQFSEAHLEVLGYPQVVQLAVAGGLVDRVQPIEARALASFFARNGELPEDWRDYFSEFNIILSYLFDPDEMFRTNVARCSPAQFIQAPHRPNEAERVHATKVFLKPLERLAIFEPDATPRLTSHGSRVTTPCLALHPGSGSERKNWPQTKWSALIGRLLATTPLELLLVGGEAEGARLEQLASGRPPERVSVARNLPLVELAGRLQTCRAFVGHDSGITHLAAALGLPCVILWAESIEDIWCPPGRGITVVRDLTGLNNLSVDRVMKELQPLLG